MNTIFMNILCKYWLINKRRFFKKLYTPELALYALEESGGMLPREILKIKASNDSFCAPLWIRHWEPESVPELKELKYF